MNSKNVLLALSLILFSMMAKAQTTYYVKSSVTASGAGTSWASAYKTLQEALTMAASGDQIWVAAGTYYPDEGGTFADNDRTACFSMKEGVKIYGGFEGNEILFSNRNWKTNLTILSGDIDKNDGSDFSNTANNASSIIVNNNNGLTAAAVLDGFTISDGNANGIKFYFIGGGMENTNVSPSIVNCSFLRNKANFGGGAMYNTDSAPTIINCIFSGNSASTGGAIRNYNSDVTIINCVFSGNSASESGGGMYISESNPTLVNCTFSGNNSPGAGAVYLFSNSAASFKNCIFRGNSSEVGTSSSSATYSYCLVEGVDLTTIGTGNLDGTNAANNPNFISPLSFTNAPTTAGNLRLSFCSPVRNLGKDDENSSLTDPDGNPRKIGTIDLGAYEYQSSASTQILYVKTNGDDTKDGQSWTNAYKTLQKALQQACSGTQIWVAAGTYYPDEGGSIVNNDRSATFIMKNGVAIYGGFLGNITETLLSHRNWKANVTTLSGDIDQNDGSNFTNNEGNSNHVIYNNGNGLNTTAILDGFSILGGNSTNSFSNGGGMYNKNAAPTVTNCSFVGNDASNYGGGMYNDNASPNVTNCTFVGNRAQQGAGMTNFESNPNVTNCAFWGNGGYASMGMHCTSSNPILTTCSFAGVSVVGYVGSNPILKNCIVWGGITSSSVYISTPVYINTIVKGVYLGSGVFDGTQDPLFALQPTDSNVPSTIGDLRLQACSPALNQGNNADNSIITDLDGNPRIYNNGIVDLGAYEYQGSSAATTPTVGSTGPSTCGGADGSITLSGFLANTIYSVTYTKGATNVPAANFTANAGGVITLTDLSAGSYTNILATFGACVSTAANATLSDPVPPTATIGSNNSPICAGGNVSFTVSGTNGATLTYTLTGLMGNQTLLLNGSNQTITSNNANAHVTLTLISVSKNACNVPLSATATVTINPLPTAGIFGTTAVCQNAPFPQITFTGSNGTAPYTFTYQINGGDNLTVSTGSGNSVSISQTTATTAVFTYSLVSVQDAKGCNQNQSGSVTITVNASPVVSMPQTELCTGQTLTLSPASGGTWISSNPSIAGVTTSGLVTAIAPGAANFTFTQTGTGCSATTANVLIKQTPSSNLTASKADVCPNTEVTLLPSCSVPTAAVHWNPGAPTVTPNAATLPYVYKARCILDGCVGNESSVEVRTHRILVDMKDLDVGTLPLPIARAVKDNMAPTNLIEAPVFPRRWTFIATGCNDSESAVFTLSGPVNFSAIDNEAPYSMFSNEGSSFYSLDHPNYGNGSSFPNGTYTLQVDLKSQNGVGGPFPKNRVATGSLLANRTLQFTLKNPSARSGLNDGQVMAESESFVKVSPNPVLNTMQLHISQAQGASVTIDLLDAWGRNLLQRYVVPPTNQHREEFELSHLSSGIYFVSVTTQGRKTTLKVVKIR